MSTNLDPTEYNRKQQQASMDAKVAQTIAEIGKAEASLSGKQAKSIVHMMDLVESVIKCCGGESKVTFLDVTPNFIKISTRVPLSANLFQFKPEEDSNPRFHKVVTKILLLSASVEGVRWLPSDNGALLLCLLYTSPSPRD